MSKPKTKKAPGRTLAEHAAADILEALQHPAVMVELPTGSGPGKLRIEGLEDPATLKANVEFYRDSFTSEENYSKAVEAFRRFLIAAGEQQKSSKRLTRDQYEKLYKRMREEFKDVNFDVFSNFPT